MRVAILWQSILKYLKKLKTFLPVTPEVASSSLVTRATYFSMT